jgi:hypothetical protein
VLFPGGQRRVTVEGKFKKALTSIVAGFGLVLNIPAYTNFNI